VAGDRWGVQAGGGLKRRGKKIIRKETRKPPERAIEKRENDAGDQVKGGKSEARGGSRGKGLQRGGTKLNREVGNMGIVSTNVTMQGE